MPTRPILKYLLYSLCCGLIVITQSLALLAVLALGFGFSLAIQERLRKLDENRPAQVDFAGGHWVSDGGSFPAHETERRPLTQQRPTVIDGGSLEHHNR